MLSARILKDTITKEQILPVTHEQCVVDDDGKLSVIVLKEKVKTLTSAIALPVKQNVELQTGFYRHIGTLPPMLDNTTLPNDFNSVLLDVVEGERYKLDLYAWGTGVTIYQIFSDTKTIVDGGKATTTPTHREIEIEIPKGAKTMFVNGYSKKPLNVYKYVAENGLIGNTLKRGVYYKNTEGILTLVSNYGNEKIEITFGKRGSNNLPDFRTIKVGNDIIANNETDWHSPFRVGAVNNIDGDNPSARTFYTGGNHNYNNYAGNYDVSLATARCSNLIYLADNKPIVDNDFGYAENIVIEWTNYVQGYNTKKSDGSGREIIKECHRMTFDGVAFVSSVNLVPLEDVEIISYFGFQIKLNSLTNKLRFIGGINRNECSNLNVDVYTSGNALPNAIYAYGSKHSVLMEVDRTYDLGKGVLFEGTDGMFTTNNPKGYANLIKNSVLKQGEMYSARGSWIFAPVND